MVPIFVVYGVLRSFYTLRFGGLCTVAPDYRLYIGIRYGSFYRVYYYGIEGVMGTKRRKFGEDNGDKAPDKPAFPVTPGGGGLRVISGGGDSAAPPAESKGKRARTVKDVDVETATPEQFRVTSLGNDHKIKIPTIRVAEAIIQCDGFIGRAAHKIGVHYMTLNRYIKAQPRLQQLVRDVTEITTDLAESKLREQIKLGNLQAITFYLRCKGRDRGWIEDPKTDVKKPDEVRPLFKYELGGGAQPPTPPAEPVAAPAQGKEKVH